MSSYLVQLDLISLARRLSQSLGCRLSAADVRKILHRAGSVELSGGWLMSDLRPLMVAYAVHAALGGDG